MKTTLAALGLTALAIAGCGGGSSYGGGSSSNSSSTNAAASSASMSGFTVYTFSKDTKGKSNCSGACAKNWPPATSAPGMKVTTIKRADGTSQVALNGHPLYHFIADKKAGDTNGNGLNEFGGLWKTAGNSSASQPASPSRSGY